MVDKIGHPYVLLYANHVSSHPNTRKAPHAIVPAIHMFNFATGRQEVYDNDNGTTSVDELCFQKTNVITTMLIFRQWIDNSMRMSCLITISLRSWTLFLLLMPLVTRLVVMLFDPLKQ